MIDILERLVAINYSLNQQMYLISMNENDNYLNLTHVKPVFL